MLRKTLWASFFVYAVFAVLLCISIGTRFWTFSNILSLLCGGATVVLMITLICSVFKESLGKKIALSIFYLFYVLFFVYHLRVENSFDFKLFMDNLNILFYRESADIISSRFKLLDLILIFSLIFSFIYFGVLKNKEICKTDKVSRKKPVFILLIYGALCLSPYNRYDEVSIIFKDIFRYFYNPVELGNYGRSLLKKEYPFMKKLESKGDMKDLPNIFILPIESFNANFVERKNEKGVEYTPFFNSLISKGLYVENFYGHSIQTAKGIFSILCSIIPKTDGKVFEKHFETNFRCLPEVLKERGYTNIFYQSYRDINFDNTGNFLKNNHFDYVEALDENGLTEKERRENIWGWGPQDDLLYKNVFKKIDKLKKGNKQRFFVTLQGISSHMTFDKVPKNQRLMYKGKQNKKQSYANSIRIVDHYLQTFFRELKKREFLKNSVVIVTGDHSFPVGEHNVYYNESGFYNEFFKVPFLMLAEGNLESTRIKKKSYSQVDIAPTLLDLIGVQTSNSFQGQSILKKEESYQFLIQPYSGKYLSIIKFPFKYVFHEKTGQEYLFNIEKDSLEKQNLLPIRKNWKNIHKIFSELKSKIDYFYVNDYLIETNKIWRD